MRKICSYGLVIVLASVVFCQPLSAQVPPGAIAQEAIVARFQGETDETKVVFYHVRGESTGFVLQDKEGRQVAHVKRDDGIAVFKGTGVYDVTGDGWPEIVLVSQAGAKTLETVIYAYESGSLRELWQWSGWNFRIVKLGKRPVIVIIPSQTGTLKKLIAWEKGRFLEVSERFPGFFSDEVEVQLRTLNSSDQLPYYVFVQACQLTAQALLYGKNYWKAMKICNQALEIVRDSPRATSRHVNATTEMLAEDRRAGVAKIRSTLARIEEAKRKNMSRLPQDRSRQ